MTAAHALPFELAYNNLSIFRDADGAALYFGMNVVPRPCYTWNLVHDIINFQNTLVSPRHNMEQPLCVVWASVTPGVFSLGGDLTLFQSLIESQDRKTLARYAVDCVTGLFNHMSLPNVVTVSLLEGDALGAGLETALSSDVVIAEKGIRCGFPEVLFNLVPGHGAFYLLARRIGAKAAERMIRDGNVLTSEQLHELGLVDVLVDKGCGRRAVRQLIEDNRKTWNAFRALQHIKRHCTPITHEALLASADIWVDAAMQLSERDLRMMARLVRRQEKRVGLATVAMEERLSFEPAAAAAFA